MSKEVFSAIWTLVSITVGSGILALPYVFSKAGFLTGLLVILITGILMTIINLYLGEIVLRTKGKHQLTGLAGIYLGKKWKIITFLVTALSIYGALTAYIVGSGEALKAILGGNSTVYSIIFFIILAIVIYFSIKVLDNFESLFTPIKIIIVIVLSVLLLKFVNFSRITVFHPSMLLVPYGIAIFSFTGISAIPEINEELKNKRNMIKAILFGMLISFLIYIIFAFSVVGAVDNVTEIATISLAGFGKGIDIFANIFAVFAMATAFVALGFALKENMILDYKIKNSLSWLGVIIIPLILAMSGVFGFAKLMELSGAIAISILLGIIMIIHSKAKKLGNRKPEYEIIDNKIIKLIIFLLLTTGIIYSIIVTI